MNEEYRVGNQRDAHLLFWGFFIEEAKPEKFWNCQRGRMKSPFAVFLTLARLAGCHQMCWSCATSSGPTSLIDREENGRTSLWQSIRFILRTAAAQVSNFPNQLIEQRLVSAYLLRAWFVMIILGGEEEKPSAKLLIQRIYLPCCLFRVMIEHNRKYFLHRFEWPWEREKRSKRLEFMLASLHDWILPENSRRIPSRTRVAHCSPEYSDEEYLVCFPTVSWTWESPWWKSFWIDDQRTPTANEEDESKRLNTSGELLTRFARSIASSSFCIWLVRRFCRSLKVLSNSLKRQLLWPAREGVDITLIRSCLRSSINCR